MLSAPRSYAVYAAVSLAVLACRDDRIAGPSPAPPNSTVGSVNAPDGAIPALQELIRDVPAVRVDKESLPEDLADSDLIAAVAAAGGIVHIGFKPATAPRTKDSGIFPGMMRAEFAGARNNVTALGAVTRRSFRGMASIVAKIPPELAPVIRRLPIVNYLEPEGRAELTDTQDTSWGARRIRAPQAWSPLGVRGNGANIVILDSGSDPTHRFTFNADGPANMGTNCYYIAPDFTSCDDESGHGTHVSGIAAAKDNLVGYIGVAHDPTTTSMVKVCAPFVGCPFEALRAGLDWAATNGRPRQVINMSLGSCTNNIGVYEAVARVYASGALLIASAGNYYSGAGCLPDVMYPAKYTEVVAVSGTLDDDSFAPSNFVCPEVGSVGGSRYGREVEVSAPFYARSMWLNGEYRNDCGTSMAAPVVTAVAALIWSKWPNWYTLAVRERLQAARVDLGSAGRDSYFGYGRVDAFFAVSDENPLSSVSISGPSAVYEYDTGTWTASAIGGFSPVILSWEVVVNGSIVHTATGGSVTYTNRGYVTDGPSFYVAVTAKDATGATVSAFQTVSVLLCDDPTDPC